MGKPGSLGNLNVFFIGNIRKRVVSDTPILLTWKKTPLCLWYMFITLAVSLVPTSLAQLRSIHFVHCFPWWRLQGDCRFTSRDQRRFGQDSRAQSPHVFCCDLFCVQKKHHISYIIYEFLFTNVCYVYIFPILLPHVSSICSWFLDTTKINIRQ